MPRVLLIFAISVSFLFGLTACRQSKINNNAAPPENLDNKSSKNFLISLERTGCYGTCPSYTLVILSDGTIIFSSPTYFVDDGKKLVPKSLRPIVSKLSESQLKQLTDAFEKANYFALKDKYLDATDGGCPTWATDSSKVFTAIEIDGKKKSIEHYLGCRESGTETKVYPKELFDLENKIDEIVDTKQWLK